MASDVLPDIPPGLVAYADQIRATVKDALRLKLKPAKDLLPWQSKVGGTPYLPVSAEHPRCYNGDPLKLLAQVNFSESPRLPGYPEKGILQFFIDPTEMGYGLDIGNIEQDRFRIVYFDTVEEDTSKLKTVPFRIDGHTIIDTNGKHYTFEWPLGWDHQLSIEFEPFQQYMTPNDYRVSSDIFGFDPDYPWHHHYDSAPEIFDQYEEHFRAGGHQIGGYPFFTQDDPRGDNDEFSGYELLLQLSSEFFGDRDCEICWGDMGVANFFIRPEDLEEGDFSEILYNWDCT